MLALTAALYTRLEMSKRIVWVYDGEINKCCNYTLLFFKVADGCDGVIAAPDDSMDVITLAVRVSYHRSFTVCVYGIIN